MERDFKGLYMFFLIELFYVVFFFPVFQTFISDLFRKMIKNYVGFHDYIDNTDYDYDEGVDYDDNCGDVHKEERG